jgi:hypothetical protein
VAQGADLLTASDDVAAMSAIVGLMGAEDLETGLEIARTAGELWAISDAVDLLQMPVLSAVLEDRGELLQRVAVDVMLRAASTRALSQVMATKSEEIAELGAEEVAEGVVRMAASEALAERSEDLEIVGIGLAERGEAELEVAAEASEFARDLAAEGVAEAVVGGAELGAAATMANLADLDEEVGEEDDETEAFDSDTRWH